jgi:hypothetical protein
VSHAYTEDQLVEQPAIGLFAALGWQTVSALEETFGAGASLGRETKGEVVLKDRLRAALTRFNPDLPAEAIQTAIDELARDRSAMSLEAANREIYQLLKDGIEVSVPNREQGGQKIERLRVVDWAQPDQNDFLLVSQRIELLQHLDGDAIRNIHGLSRIGENSAPLDSRPEGVRTDTLAGKPGIGDVLQVAAVEHALAVCIGDAMGPGSEG